MAWVEGGAHPLCQLTPYDFSVLLQFFNGSLFFFFCRSNGPHGIAHMCPLVSRPISVDKEECVPVSGADSGMKHVFFVVLGRWFKSSLFAATLSSCQGKHSK